MQAVSRHLFFNVCCGCGVVTAVGCFVWFLQRFGLDRALASPDLASFSQSQYMTLDAVTLRDLEVCMIAAESKMPHR